MTNKPLGRRNYGSIPHLPGSRLGPADHSCHEGQARIATLVARDRHDEIFVQEKLDGNNVGVALIDGALVPLGRAGYPAATSPFKQHMHFHNWVFANYECFMEVLGGGERLVGEWLAQAHGTRYELGRYGLKRDPFVAFDIMVEDERLPYDDFVDRTNGYFARPWLIHRGEPFSVEDAMRALNVRGTDTAGRALYGHYGALEPVEGAVWRVERDALVDRHSGQRKRVVDFLVKYVREDKVDGKYLPNVSGKEAVWNWLPD